MSRPSLSVDGVTVYFDNDEDHADYIRYEYMNTRWENRWYSEAWNKESKEAARQKRDIARRKAYNNWLKKRGE